MEVAFRSWSLVHPSCPPRMRANCCHRVKSRAGRASALRRANLVESQRCESYDAAVRMLRIVVCLVIASSIALVSVPAQTAAAEVAKLDCCAKMKTPSAECEKETPKPDTEKQCCPNCPLGLAVLATTGAPFVYPPVGDETFAGYISSGRFRPHRPPVPPPRA